MQVYRCIDVEAYRRPTDRWPAAT